MNFKRTVLLLCALGALVAALALLAQANSIEGDKARSSRLPKLFDFKYFKQTFAKRYGSILEELARRKYYLARSFRAFVAAIKFKSRRLSHYLAINHMSDYSPKELLEMRNRAEVAKETRKQRNEAKKERQQPSSEGASHKRSELADDDEQDAIPNVVELDMSDEQVAEKLDELAREHANEPAYGQLLEMHQQERHRRRRRKRSLGTTTTDYDNHGGRNETSARQLSLNDLFKAQPAVVDEYSSENPDQLVRLRVPSNNPEYEQIELPSKGLDDQQTKMTWFRIKSKDEPAAGWSNSFMKQISGYLEDGKQNLDAILKMYDAEQKQLPDDEAYEDAKGKPDEIFADQRGKCMGMVRNQGTCGSCYVFAAIALLEWLHCRRTGTFTPFSEQYIIDCGRYVRGLNGCDGGDRLSTVSFIHNFGAELRVTYPYRMRDQQCPYPKSMDLKKAGYIRPNLGNAVIVPRRKWANYLKYTPLLASIFTTEDFAEYGGGVHVLKNCNKDDGHAMLLVGHGREDGLEYWLFRNSYSVGWGEKGYYKVAKKSDPKCIFIEGYTIGTSNGVNFDAKPEINKQHGREHILRHNEQSLKLNLANGLF